MARHGTHNHGKRGDGVSVAGQARVGLACVRLSGTVKCGGSHAPRVAELCGDGVGALRQRVVWMLVRGSGLLIEHTVVLVWTCRVFDECFVAEQCERWWQEHLLARTPAV